MVKHRHAHIEERRENPTLVIRGLLLSTGALSCRTLFKLSPFPYSKSQGKSEQLSLEREREREFYPLPMPRFIPGTFLTP